MQAYRIIQIVLGIVLIAMVWLNGNLALDQQLAFTTLIGLLLIDKFINFNKSDTVKQEKNING